MSNKQTNKQTKTMETSEEKKERILYFFYLCNAGDLCVLEL